MKKLIFLLLLFNYAYSQEIPVAMTPVPSATQIIWKWHSVTGATGFRMAGTPVYATAVDIASDTVISESGLISNTTYTRYIWAYNLCGHGSPLTLTITTLDNFVCGTSKTITHTAGTVAPISKTVTYATIKDIPGEHSKCWITKNLGATSQAISNTDTSEAAAGWYWQFNRKQGYKRTTTARTPNSAWITSINEYLDWESGNDPCLIELGTGWRIPTSVEWTNVDSWTDYNGPWNSALKLHMAGYLYSSDASLNLRGVHGAYWSSTQTSATYGQVLYFYSSTCGVSTYKKSSGFTVRCIKDSIISIPVATVPTVTTIAASTITQTTAIGGGEVTWDGGATVIVKGICWDTSTAPTTSDSYTTEGNGIGMFASNLTGLTGGTLYYARAYATNSEGTAYGNQVSFTTSATWACGNTIIVSYSSPVTKTVTYGTVTGVPGEPSKCWITKNLGADQQATSSGDVTEASAGWYWQFNKKQGYKYDITRTPSSAWTPVNESSNWLTVNDPCTDLGTGWRLPTLTEWKNVDLSWTSLSQAYASLLKIHAAGRLYYSSGTLGLRGSDGAYWTSTQSANTYGNRLYLTTTTSAMGTSVKAFGYSIRCIK